jgi:hypothetical protein
MCTQVIGPKHVGIVLKEGLSVSSKKSIRVKGDLCPTLSTTHNLPTLGSMLIMDVDACEVLPSGPIRKSLRRSLGQSPMYFPTYNNEH